MDWRDAGNTWVPGCRQVRASVVDRRGTERCVLVLAKMFIFWFRPSRPRAFGVAAARGLPSRLTADRATPIQTGVQQENHGIGETIRLMRRVAVRGAPRPEDSPSADLCHWR